jgi:hypothetical protein
MPIDSFRIALANVRFPATPDESIALAVEVIADASMKGARIACFPWIDNPVLGDTPVEIRYSDYRDFGGVMFPARIVRIQGGHPVLDITVSSVTANPAVNVSIPDAVRTFTPPAVNVEVEKLAGGVHYLRGGSHHSVAIDQRDHVVVVEAPQNETRSLAVIAKVKQLIPGKPIRYLVNSHSHFDHSGGLRT